MKYDVIIIGAGPSAIFSALFLYKAGIKNICLINKYTKEHHKCCSGFFTQKTVDLMKEIDLDPCDMGYKKINSMDIYFKYKKVFGAMDETKYIYYSPSANRIHFDNFLYKKIEEKNIEYKENINIKEIAFEDKKVVTSNNEEIYYNHIILADGAVGVSSKYNKNTNKKMIGIEARIENVEPKPIKGEFNFGIVKRGYAWIYQNEKYTTIGFTDKYDKNINYRDLLEEYANKKNISIKNADIKGAFIPYVPRNLMYDENSFFIGDAAGLVDALTQEGLYYSILSAKYAVQAIKDNNPESYEEKMRFSVRVIKSSRIFAKLFYIKIIQKIIWSLKQKENDFRIYLLDKYIFDNRFNYIKCIKYYYDFQKYKIRKNKMRRENEKNFNCR